MRLSETSRLLDKLLNAFFPRQRRERLKFRGGRLLELGHVLVHGYFTVDLEVVWDAIQQDLPRRESAIRRLTNS
jgi:uncharacterized protein with HEPN domain